MTSQTGQQINSIYILPNISRSRSNQSIEFGQLIVPWLIEYNIRNITQNVAEKLAPDPFTKNQN